MYLSEAKNAFLLACKAENKSPSTIRGYKDALSELVKDVGDMDVTALTPDHITLHMVNVAQKPGKYGQPYSSYSTMKRYSVIRSFVKWMYLRHFVARKITDETKPPKLSDDLPTVLNSQQVEELYDTALSFRNQVIFEVFLETGLRLNEVANLSVDDLHIEEGWAKVYGKGKKEAIIPLGNKLCRDLYIYIHKERKAAAGVDNLFVTDEGYGLGRAGMGILVRRHMSKLGYPGKHGPHVLRHTFATNFIRNSGNLEVLRRIMRHTDIKTTQRYLHLQTEDLIKGLNETSPLNKSRR